MTAEKLIASLKKEISAIKSGCNFSTMTIDEEVEHLKKQNAALKKDIEVWKNKLNSAEEKNGPFVANVIKETEYHPHSGSNQGPVKVEKRAPAADVGQEKKEPEQKPGKKAEKPKKEKPKKEAAAKEEPLPVHVGRLDMRVGLIRTAKRHPDADALYVEEVDVGEEKPRTVISGLVKFIPEAEMQNRKAILMCNLKPSKMRGIMSEAMVMCASTPDKVEILSPPEDSKPGDPVHVEGFERKPDAQLNPKKKIFETCAPDLKCNEDKVATYKGVPWLVNGKPCYSQTLAGVQIK